MKLLTINNLSVCYGKIEAIKKVSISVSKSEIISIIGANGAGKSTLLKTISGLQKMSGGDILYKGKTLPQNIGKIAAAGITHVPEGRRVFPSLSCKMKLKSRIFGFGRAMDADIDKCIACGVDGMIIEHTVNPYLCKYAYDLTPEKLSKRLSSAKCRFIPTSRSLEAVRFKSNRVLQRTLSAVWRIVI
jgi:ABC-type sugar transport system ATPase subunit